MVQSGRVWYKMPCESCAVQFSVFKRKRTCSECERYYCGGCLRRGGGIMCAPCRVLSTRPLSRHTITHLKVRDLQCFLQRQNVSTRGCVEKEELVGLCVSHVNSAAYKRRGPRTGAFSSLKGFTNNINDFLNSAFDIRTSQNEAPPARTSCFNSTHVYRPPSGPASSVYSSEGRFTPRPGSCLNCTHSYAPRSGPAPDINVSERHFSPTPGGEQDIRVSPPGPEPAVPRSTSEQSAHIDTADCFEIEDLDDAGWEFVTTPADPLPNGNANDSEVLLTATGLNERQNTSTASESAPCTAPRSTQGPPTEPAASAGAAGGCSTQGPPTAPRPSAGAAGGCSTQGPPTAPRPPASLKLGGTLGTPQRSSSELELHRSPSADTDTASLQDEPLMDRAPETPPEHIVLERLSEADLETLSVRQLKELLRRNRVEFRGCLERVDLLQRARMLWRNHAQLQQDIESLPTEECCKICMAAPLECVLLECGHIAACTACSKQLAECPICRQYVVRAVRFFRS